MKPGTQAKPVFKSTKLHKAVRNKNLTALRKLLAERDKNKIDVDQQDESGNTALLLADINGYHLGYDYFFALLEADANPHIRDETGYNVLHFAISSEKLSWLRLLLLYKPENYETVLNHHSLSAAYKIEYWNNRSPELNIYAKIKKTLADVVIYKDRKQQAETSLSKAVKAAPSQLAIHYLAAASVYTQIAELFLYYVKDVEGDKDIQKWPDEYNALLTHYRRKVLQHYQLALDNAYTKVPVNGMTEEQQEDCLKTHDKLVALAIILNEKAIAQRYRTKAAEFCLQIVNLQKSSQYQWQAIEYYQAYVTESDVNELTEQDMSILNQAAQLYHTFAETVAAGTEEQLTYQRQARAIYAKLAQASLMQHKPEQVKAYNLLAGITEPVAQNAAATGFNLLSGCKQLKACLVRKLHGERSASQEKEEDSLVPLIEYGEKGRSLTPRYNHT